MGLNQDLGRLLSTMEDIAGELLAIREALETINATLDTRLDAPIVITVNNETPIPVKANLG